MSIYNKEWLGIKSPSQIKKFRETNISNIEGSDSESRRSSKYRESSPLSYNKQ